VNATPGAHTVTLTAKLADGESRTGTVVLNVNPPPCVVPKLKGKTLKAAKSALAAAHCTIGKVHTAHSKTKKGKIIGQSPGKGHTLANGAAVSVTESLGPKKQPKKHHK
jgi:beta-lactam-binding protein with PASTA domain